MYINVETHPLSHPLRSNFSYVIIGFSPLWKYFERDSTIYSLLLLELFIISIVVLWNICEVIKFVTP